MTAADQTTSKVIHHGRNIKRFREMFGLKQEALALSLGPDWSQKKVSRLEEHEQVADDVLQQVAAVLKVPVEAIKNFDEQAAVNYFNTFNDSTITGAGAFSSHNYHCTYHPLDKLAEALEENKKLYEQLLQSEREKVALLQRLLDQRS